MQLYLITVKSQDFSQLDVVYWISLIAISFSDFLKPVFLSIEAESEGIGNFQWFFCRLKWFNSVCSYKKTTLILTGQEREQTKTTFPLYISQKHILSERKQDRKH